MADIQYDSILGPDGTKIVLSSSPLLRKEERVNARNRRAEQIHSVRTIRREPDGTEVEVIYRIPGRLLHTFLFKMNESPGKTGELLSVRVPGLGCDRESRAHHEAGHGLALYCVDNLSHMEVWHEWVGGSGGHTAPKERWRPRYPPVQNQRGWWGPSPADRESAREHLVSLYAGGRAHRRFLLSREGADTDDVGLTILYAAEGDRREAQRILANLGLAPDEELPAFRDEAEAEAIQLVSERWEQIEKVAAALLSPAKGGKLTSDDVRALIDGS